MSRHLVVLSHEYRSMFTLLQVLQYYLRKVCVCGFVGKTCAIAVANIDRTSSCKNCLVVFYMSSRVTSIPTFFRKWSRLIAIGGARPPTRIGPQPPTGCANGLSSLMIFEIVLLQTGDLTGYTPANYMNYITPHPLTNEEIKENLTFSRSFNRSLDKAIFGPRGFEGPGNWEPTGKGPNTRWVGS